MEDENKSNRIKSVSPIISQIVLRKLGMYCSERLNVDLYYLLESINLLISEVGEDFMIEKYKERKKDWNVIRAKLDDINVKVVRVKTFYDPIADKKFSKVPLRNNDSKVEIMLKSHFLKVGKKLALMQRDLYDVFVLLVNETTIQRQQIKSEAFKILEHQGFRTMDNKKSPSGGSD